MKYIVLLNEGKKLNYYKQLDPSLGNSKALYTREAL